MSESRAARQKPSSGAAAALQLVGLSAFAIAQPLFDVLGRGPTFFIAHDAGSMHIVLFSVLVLGFPAITVLALAGVAHAIGPRAFAAARWLLLALLATAVLAPLTEPLVPGHGTLSLIVASVAGGIVAQSILRSRPIGLVFSVLGIAPLIFGGLFLARPEIAPLLRSGSASVSFEVPRSNADPSIVFLVFDALSSSALVDEYHQIDRGLFPNFAALADESTWYRNASANEAKTHQALPVLLTGRERSAKKLAISEHHPHNLFRLLSGSHAMHVVEPVTRLYEPETESEATRSPPNASIMRSLLRDAGLVSLHILLPAELITELPSVEDGWAHFGGTPSRIALEKSSYLKRLVRARGVDRIDTFRDFLAGIGSDEIPTLHFLHFVFPHYPWIFTPSGHHYDPSSRMPLGMVDMTWGTNEHLVTLGLQRYLLQVGLADVLLGELLDRLRETGLHERSILIVTSDHGAAFDLVAHKRIPTEKTLRDVLQVPLFIRLPEQKTGRIDDANVESIDLLPGLMHVLGRDPIPGVDGSPFPDSEGEGEGEGEGEPPGTKVLRANERRFEVDGSRLRLGATHERKLTRFPERSSWAATYALAGHAGWMGRKVRELEVAPEPVGSFSLLESLDDVRLDRDLQPLLLSGTLRSANPEWLDREIVVSLNGLVRATSFAYEILPGGEAKIALLIPFEALREGRNTIGIFTPGRDERLHRFEHRETTRPMP